MSAGAGGVASLRDATEEELFGGKAAQLAASLRAGLPVPDGAALSWPFVDALCAGSAQRREDLAGVLGRLKGPLAVRSSAVGEDSKDASFAGIHVSVLNVTGAEAVLEAVRASWESARAPSALAYRLARGLTGVPRAAVVLQRFVEPDVAGVLFTRHPVTGADETVVEATWGLGEALVGGIVTPDHYRLDHQGRVLESRLGDKDVAVVVSPRGGTEELSVEPSRARAACLALADLERLHALGRACDAAFGGASDVEWLLAGGELHLVQRRAITTRARSA